MEVFSTKTGMGFSIGIWCDDPDSCKCWANSLRLAWKALLLKQFENIFSMDER